MDSKLNVKDIESHSLPIEEKNEEDQVSEYEQKMENYVCNAIPLKEMVNKGELTHIYTDGKKALFTDPNASCDPQQRMKKLNADLRTFKSGYLSLDSNGTGIFVQHDEDDPAFMKCLITGPENTPYSWGLFEFDVYIPPSYPDKPPKFTHRTTNEGQIRFNPNLYNNGYVCLSLLGTWDGPSWDPKLSSMIQILNSLQALVLVDEPYYNEPGIGQDNVSATQYKHMVREATLRYAIVGHLNNPSPIWKSVIRDHFNLVKPQICKVAAKWVKEAPEVASRCSYGNVGCQGIRSTMEEAYHLVQQAFDQLPIVQNLNDIESKHIQIDKEEKEGEEEEKEEEE